MSDNNIKEEYQEKNKWTLHKNNDGEYEEKICPFLFITVIFSIKPYKRSTILSFTESFPSEKAHNCGWYRYKVKGSVDYAKKIVENTVKEFFNIPIDLGDIDLCLKKAFSLRKINTLKIFPRVMRHLTKILNH